MVARDPELETTIAITMRARRVSSVFISKLSFMANVVENGISVEGRG
jgi:hypothetical protein